jgi:ribonuclease BN (tRNA processing enzyme)
MKIEVLGTYGGASLGCRMTSLLINDTIALDAGSLAQRLAFERQPGVRTIILTHSHWDHTNSLPFFVENVFDLIDAPIDIYASSATIYSVRRHLFNNDVWPDFSRMPNNLLPAMRFHELQQEVPVIVDSVKLTPFEVDHLVPTLGFLIEEGSESLLWSSDTGPTQRLWELANLSINLKALCVETSFDNSMQNVADISLHLTPQTLASELEKLERRVPILLHHLKPPCIEQIRSEIRQLQNPDLHYLEQGKSYKL